MVVPVADRSTRSSRRRKERSWLRRVVLVVVLAFGVFVGGIGATGSSSVQANPFDFFCSYTPTPEQIEEENPGDNVFYAWPGTAGQLAQAQSTFSPATALAGATAGMIAGDNQLDTSVLYPPEQRVTAYEWWGTAGLTWTEANYEDIAGECGVEGIFGRGASNIISNLIWVLVSTLGSFGLLLYYYAAVPNALTPFLSEGGPVDTLLSNSLDGIFLVFLAPIIVLTALWLAYVGLVKRRSSETVQGVVWMIGAATAALFLFSNPLLVPNFINNAISQIQATTLTVITSATAGGDEAGLCALPATTAPEGEITPELQAQIAEANRFRAIRTSQCVQWQVFLFTPWAAGQFGSLAQTPVEGAVPVTINGFPIAEPGAEGPDPATAMALVQLDATTLNHNQALSGGLTPEERAVKISQRQAIYDQMESIWNVEAGEVTNPEANSVLTWTGADRVTRLGAAFLSLISMLIGGIPIFLLTFSLLLYQLGTLFLLLLAPVFLTLGINPGWGRRIALGWLEQLINLSIKRVGTTILIAILLAVIQAIVFSGGAWIAQVFLVGATGIGIMVFRGRILEMLASVNLGGTNAIDVEDVTRQGARQAGGLATGAVVGAGMALAGGAGVGAAVKAGATGAAAGTGGGTTAGALTGYGTANRAIDKADQEKKRKQAEEDAARQLKQSKEDAATYEAMMEKLSQPDSGLTPEEIHGIRETRRNLGAQEALIKAEAVMAQVDEREQQKAEQVEAQAREHAARMDNDVVYRHQQQLQERELANSEREQEMVAEIDRMRQEDDAMSSSSPADAQRWIARWRGEVGDGSDAGRPVPMPDNAQLRSALEAAGVSLRDRVSGDGSVPGTLISVQADGVGEARDDQNSEEMARQMAERALRRATGQGPEGGYSGSGDRGGPSRPPQA